MEEKIYIISDIEMGRRDAMDDFNDDDAIVNFINSLPGNVSNVANAAHSHIAHTAHSHIAHSHADSHTAGQKITLILNGDTFDFLKMAYKEAYPRHITEEISLWKLNEIIQNHAKIFETLKNFLQNLNNKVFFVIGNHDADLVWPGVQQRLRAILNNQENVFFDFWYRRNGLHAEHGHLLEPFFSIDHKRPLLRYHGKTILNTPLGTQVCFSYLTKLRRKFPKDEQAYHKLLDFNQLEYSQLDFNQLEYSQLESSQNDDLKKVKRSLALKVLWNDLIIAPLRYPADPTRRVPWLKLLDHFLHFGFDIINDKKIQMRAIKKVVRQNPQAQCFALGHFHIFGQHDHLGKKVLVTDTWRNEYNLNRQNMQRLEQKPQKKKKSFAEIIYRNDQLQQAQLKIFPQQ